MALMANLKRGYQRWSTASDMQPHRYHTAKRRVKVTPAPIAARSSSLVPRTTCCRFRRLCASIEPAAGQSDLGSVSTLGRVGAWRRHFGDRVNEAARIQTVAPECVRMPPERIHLRGHRCRPAAARQAGRLKGVAIFGCQSGQRVGKQSGHQSAPELQRKQNDRIEHKRWIPADQARKAHIYRQTGQKPGEE